MKKIFLLILLISLFVSQVNAQTIIQKRSFSEDYEIANQVIFYKQPNSEDYSIVVLPTSCTVNQIIAVDSDGYWVCTNPGASSVSDCTVGPCLDGSSDGGTYMGLYDGNSNWSKIFAGDSSVDLSWILPTAYPAGTYLLTSTTAGQLGTTGTLNITTINLPSSDANPGTTAGQIRHDSTDTDSSSGGTVKWYDGTNVRSVIDAGTSYTYVVRTEYLPVAYMEDGAAPPAASAVLASTRKVRTRAFDGAANENLEIHWLVPDDYVGGIKFRFIGYVSSATAPANTEVVAFSLAGCSNGNSDVLGCTAGTAQTSSLTADATYVQYDRLAGAYSSAITVTNIVAGESVQFILERLATTTDTYAQDFALAGIEIKYQSKIMLNSTY